MIEIKLFPIIAEYGGHAKTKTTDYIPYDIIALHENQALKNHGQTLERLAERGGLGYDEALAVLEDRDYLYIEQRIAKEKVFNIISNFEQ